MYLELLPASAGLSKLLPMALLLLLAHHAVRGAAPRATPPAAARSVPRDPAAAHALRAALLGVPPPGELRGRGSSQRHAGPAMCAPAGAYGEGMTQVDMMDKDMLILVDEDDRVSGAMSKRDAHTFNSDNPRGVWTNACCSHPLHGRVPDEVDRDETDLVKPGIKHAARRKLFHELGIPEAEVPIENFRFLSRFRYWAADTLTYGDEAPWGEHEVDYILFVQGDVTLDPNPDEVGEVRYVTEAQLRSMLDDPTLRWSPWFIGIMERAGWEYWADLTEAMKDGGRFVTNDIIFFDPPDAHKAKYNLASHGSETGVQRLHFAETATVRE